MTDKPLRWWNSNGTAKWNRPGYTPVAGSSGDPYSVVALADWASLPAGAVTLAGFKSFFPNTSMAQSNLVNSSIVTVSGVGNVYDLKLAANSYGTGIVVQPRFFGDGGADYLTDVICNYKVRFVGASFPFGWGGKLPGLAGFNSSASLSESAGGSGPSNNSFSARHMWIGPGAYGRANSPAELIGYSYHPGMGPTYTDGGGGAGDGTYGDNLWANQAPYTGGFTLAGDTWYDITERILLNTATGTSGSSYADDGIYQIFVGGVLVYEHRAFRFRVRGDVFVNTLDFSFFRGGAAAGWTTPTDDHIQIQNLTIKAVL